LGKTSMYRVIGSSGNLSNTKKKQHQ